MSGIAGGTNGTVGTAGMAKESSRRLIKALLAPYHAALGSLTPDGRRAFFEPGDFPWIAALEAAWPEIRAEAQAVLADASRLPRITEVEPGQDDIANELWGWLVFFWFAHEVPENTRRCPRTAELLRAVPEIRSAMFSVLEPGMHIPPHEGPFKGVLRYHLGLVVPNGRCEIRVGDERRAWREGESLVFDDTLEHEAWNQGDGPRVVLFVDFVRPLPWPWSLVNRGLVRLAGLTPAVRNAVANARRLAAEAR